MEYKLIGRERETNTLMTALTSKRAEFIAVYGRRRVGKTFLIKQFFKKRKKDIIFFNVTGSKDAPLQEQIDHFIKRIAETFYHNAPLKTCKNWDKVFELLTDTLNHLDSQTTIILFFDEFPWMATRNSRLVQTLEYYWNQYWEDKPNLKLILCGSSASWIINKIIKNKGGLHNRLTHRIELEPFNLQETKTFLKANNIVLKNHQIVQLYMVMGGIPYYLQQIQKGKTAAQNIENLAFSKRSFLFEEFEQLFPALFDDPDTHINILRIIAKHRHGIGKTALLKRIGKKQLGSTGLEKLKSLEDAGFILSFKPHFHKRQGLYYKIIDEYTLFYFHWIEPIKKTLQVHALEKGNWTSMQNTPTWNIWQGHAFESICYKHLPQIRAALELSPTSIANSWRYLPRRQNETGAQIDLLFDRADDGITVCEIKFSTKPFKINKEYSKSLLNKLDTFKNITKTKKELFIAMIASAGLSSTPYSEEYITNVVTLDNLFRE